MAAPSNFESSEKLKEEANALMAMKKYNDAAVIYTKTIKIDPQNHVLYSNRSHAFLQMQRASRALDDATKCLQLKPDFIKGYFRKLKALEAIAATTGVDSKQEIVATLTKVLELEPNNADFLASAKKYSTELFQKYNPKPPQPPTPPPTTSSTTTSSSSSNLSTTTTTSTSTIDDPQLMKMSPIVLEFSSKTVDDVCDTFDSTPDNFNGLIRPTAYLLPTADVPLPVISIEKAFLDIKLNVECASYLRELSHQEGVVATVLVIQKSAVEVPRVWLNATREQFPFDAQQDGIFIIIECVAFAKFSYVRTMHFMPIEKDSSKQTSRLARERTVVLDIEKFRLFPPLLQ